ncbi:hypothetical protein SLEP1_g26312 [Rubroshorea leprosula]|uniref:Uncharacterized protein n=1 Tax=Rubroshorea leprosula TaxID=152421 RepID=A0AAV5JVA7_9ROSI|nr:hypothetical protein SLEP1_g26312 [Rubroshorea leprosula]
MISISRFCSSFLLPTAEQEACFRQPSLEEKTEFPDLFCSASSSLAVHEFLLGVHPSAFSVPVSPLQNCRRPLPPARSGSATGKFWFVIVLSPEHLA